LQLEPGWLVSDNSAMERSSGSLKSEDAGIRRSVASVPYSSGKLQKLRSVSMESVAAQG